MPIADTKKVQTMINIVADEVEKIKTAATRLNQLRSLFMAAGVDVAGTPLEGHLTDVSDWIDAIDAAANAAVPNGFIANRVPSHRAKALGEI